jgi:thioredoxin-related protein
VEELLVKRVIFVVMLLVASAPSLFAGGWTRSLAGATRQAKAGDKLIFVDLFADWCGWCHKMEQEVFPSETFQNATDDMVLLRLNTEDGAEGTKLARTFNVVSLPTFLVLTPDMVIAGVLKGYAPTNEFVNTLKITRTSYNDFVARRANEASFQRDFKKRFDLAEELMVRHALPDSETHLQKLIRETGLPADIRDRSFYSLAVVQLGQDRPADALATLHRFSTLQTKGESYERASLLVADIYREQGNYPAALKEYRNFKSRFPQSPLMPNVERILPQLENLVPRTR